MKIAYLSFSIFVTIMLKAQMSPVYSYTNVNNAPRKLVKLTNAGYKLYDEDYPNNKVRLYNPNNSIYKTLNLPPTVNNYGSIRYISDNLFNADSLIEFVYITTSTTNTNTTRLYIMNESGNIFLNKDSCSLGPYNIVNDPTFMNSNSLFYDGVSIKLRIEKWAGNYGFTKYLVYSLPGSIPCIDCTNGIITGYMSTNNENPNSEAARFFPNPANNDLKLQYNIPSTAKDAVIKIFDIQGKLIEELKISPTQDYVLLPSDYTNGLYVYSLIVDGKVIKNEKIILSK